MVQMVQIIGADKVKAAMRFNKRVGKEVENGLKRAALFLQRKSQEVVPIDTGALKNSAGSRLLGKGYSADAIVFYTQSYAVYVHERTDLRHAAGKQAKFLEGPAKEHRAKILAIMAGGRA